MSMYDCEAFDDAPVCEDAPHFHPGNSVPAGMPGDMTVLSLADFFRIFGDSTRIRLLCLLRGGEKCVCDLSELTGVSVSAVSHQLRILKQTKLVKYRRDGKSILYSLEDEHIGRILDQGIEHITED